MVLHPGTQRVSTTGSLSAFHSVSTVAWMVSTPPISSFMTCPSSQPEQFLRQAAIDRGALAVGEFCLGDDVERRHIADRERHVGAHHDPLTTDDVGQITQRPRILNDCVVV